MLREDIRCPLSTESLNALVADIATLAVLSCGTCETAKNGVASVEFFGSILVTVTTSKGPVYRPALQPRISSTCDQVSLLPMGGVMKFPDSLIRSNLGRVVLLTTHKHKRKIKVVSLGAVLGSVVTYLLGSPALLDWLLSLFCKG